MNNTKSNEYRGQQAYTPLSLKFYDAFVLWYNSNFVWKSPTADLVELFTTNVSNRHLDIGVGSGFFLEKLDAQNSHLQLSLMDMNANSLKYAAARVPHFKPKLIQQSILEPFQVQDSYDSVSICYLFHCVPGTLKEKASLAFKNILPRLSSGGVVFGSTVLNEAKAGNLSARLQMKFLNWRGIFNNSEDTLEDLEMALQQCFSRYELKQIGHVAIFKGYK